MNFEIKKTRQKEERIYKTIYIKEDLWKTIDAIAAENHTSFNNVVVSILEACFDYSGPLAHPGRSLAQLDRASAHSTRSAVQPMLAADQHTC